MYLDIFVHVQTSLTNGETSSTVSQSIAIFHSQSNTQSNLRTKINSLHRFGMKMKSFQNWYYFICIIAPSIIYRLRNIEVIFLNSILQKI